MKDSTSEGTIYTFYSFKGGVGRTLVLANAGITLARWGYRVLLIDWDLEAPGLDEYVRPLRNGLLQGGVIDLLRDPDLSPSAWQRFTTPLDVRPDSQEQSGILHFLPAGGSVHDYPERVQNLNLRGLYEDHGLGRRLESMRQAWKEEYELILIDSRTGISDLGGICTVQLPDILCACFTTTQQSFAGALDVARRANRHRGDSALDRGQLLALPLMTRFESSVEYALAQEWEGRFAAAAEEFLLPWLPQKLEVADLAPHLRVPYVPRWSFGEGLPALEDDPQDPLTVGYAIETIAAVLSRNLSEPSLLVQNRALYVQGADRTGAAGLRRARTFAADFAVFYDQRDAVFASQLTTALRTAGFSAIAAGTAEPDDSDGGGAQHAVIIIGSSTGVFLQPTYRSLLLTLVETDSPRVLIPVVHAPGGRRRVPPNMQSLRWVDAWERPLSDTVAEIARQVGRSLTGTVPDERSADLDLWFDESEDRFQELLREQPQFKHRFEHGYWIVGYAFEPSPELELSNLRDALMKSVQRQTGWPEWLWADWRDVRPRIVGGVIECWLAEEGAAFTGGSSSDFWRASPHGLTYLLRGYQEDDEGPPGAEPGSLFDINLPVWRMGEALLHASAMATALDVTGATVRLRAVWRGLRGRRLASINSRRLLFEEYRTNEDALKSDISVPAGEIEESLAQSVFNLLKPLYQVFDFFELQFRLVEEELESLQGRR
jgi:hypothetical protein